MTAGEKEKRKDLNSDEMIIFIALKKNLISLSGCQTHLRQYTQDGRFLNKVVKKQRDGYGLSGTARLPFRKQHVSK